MTLLSAPGRQRQEQQDLTDAFPPSHRVCSRQAVQRANEDPERPPPLRAPDPEALARLAKPKAPGWEGLERFGPPLLPRDAQ